MAAQSPSAARRFAPSTARNKAPILAVLRGALPARGRVLEIASGAGEHAVFFAREWPGLDWQPSDPDPDARASIAAWIAHEGLSNVRAPLALDAREAEWDVAGPFDALVSINMIHIAPWTAAEGLFACAGRLLKPGGVLFLYGPFMRGGVHNARSNEAFDAWLKARNPEWGVRDVDDLQELARAHALALEESIAMPADNFCLLWRKV